MKRVATLGLLLASCGDPDAATERALARAEEKAADAGLVDCSVEGAADFERSCTIERVSGPDGTTLILHHPSGGFRRLLVTTDGRGVVAADGADPAVVSILADDWIEVAVAGDRYRLPAKVKGGAP